MITEITTTRNRPSYYGAERLAPICLLLIAPLLTVTACSPSAGETPKPSTSQSQPKATGSQSSPSSDQPSAEPKIEVIEASVPESEFKPEKGVIYSGDGLVITHKNKALYWEQSGKSGLMFKSPKPKEPLSEFDPPWDGDMIEEPIQVSTNWVLFKTQYPPMTINDWKLWLWDRRKPEAAPKVFASKDPDNDRDMGVAAALHGDWLVLSKAPSHDKSDLVAYNLVNGSSKAITSAQTAGFDFVSDATVVWQEVVGEDEYVSKGLDLNTGKPYKLPEGVPNANPKAHTYATDGQTWVWTSTVEDSKDFGSGTKLRVWHPSLSAPYAIGDGDETAKILADTPPKCGLVLYAAEGKGETSFRVLNVTTKKVYELWRGWAEMAFMGDQIIISRNAGTKKDIKAVTASIPMSKFGPLTCSKDELLS